MHLPDIPRQFFRKKTSAGSHSPEQEGYFFLFPAQEIQWVLLRSIHSVFQHFFLNSRAFFIQMKTFMKPQYIKQIKLSFSGWSRLADVGVKRILNYSFFSWGTFAEALWKTVWKRCSKLLVFPWGTRSTKQPEHSTPPPISHLPVGWLTCPIPMFKNEGASVIVKFGRISVYSALYIMSQWILDVWRIKTSYFFSLTEGCALSWSDSAAGIHI